MENGECDKRSGTKPYMAFELFNKTPHAIPSDLYSLTIVLYEFLFKSRPFKDATDGQVVYLHFSYSCFIIHKLYLQAINPANAVNLVKCSEACKSFLLKGLVRDSKERFQTVNEMMTHKWYEGFDWEALKNRTMKAPFKPNTDVANCDTGTNDLNDAFGMEEEKPKIADKDQELFKNYDHNTGKEVVSSGESKTI
jgi:serine/threonine protein kinase